MSTRCAPSVGAMGDSHLFVGATGDAHLHVEGSSDGQRFPSLKSLLEHYRCAGWGTTSVRGQTLQECGVGHYRCAMWDTAGVLCGALEVCGGGALAEQVKTLLEMHPREVQG